MNSEKYVTRAEFELNEMFDSMQTLAITGSNDGRLFRIAYNGEVPLLLKVPPQVFTFVTLRKELQSILMLQTYKLQHQVDDCTKSCCLGFYGGLVLYLFIRIKSNELKVWQIATKGQVQLFGNYTAQVLDVVPYLALRDGIARIPEEWKDCLIKANTSMADIQKAGMKFTGRTIDIVGTCFIFNLFTHTESYAEIGSKPILNGGTISWLDYNIQQVNKCKISGLDGFGYSSTGTTLQAILSIRGTTSIFKGARDYPGGNIGRRNLDEDNFDKLVKLLDDSHGVSRLIPERYISVSYSVFARTCEYLMSKLLNSNSR